jgi:hypothetical protein
MTALPTGHVIATLVLFDVVLASGTILGIGREPKSILTVRCLLLDPFVSGIACTWAMSILIALETEPMSAFALDQTDRDSGVLPRTHIRGKDTI